MVSLLTPPELANTYDPQKHATGAELLNEYRDAMAWLEEHPDTGPTKAAEELDLPYGRIYNWMKGSKPDLVKTCDAASELGWFDASIQSPLGGAFVNLVAAVLSGGTIAERDFAPSFVPEPEIEDDVISAIETLGLSPRQIQREERVSEIRLESQHALLGRALVALGCPTGPKNETASVDLPEYLTDATEGQRRDFVRIYIINRGSLHGDGLAIMEQRTTSYRRDLADLFRSVIDGTVTVTERRIYLPQETVSGLYFEYPSNSQDT